MKWFAILVLIALTIGCQCPVCPELPSDPPSEPPVGTTDWAASANGATLVVTESSSFAEEENPNNVYDFNDVTYSRVYYPSFPAATVTFTITFPQTTTVSQFRAYVKGVVGAGSYPPTPDFSFYYYNGAWVLLETWTGTGAVQEKLYSAGYSNITKIKLEVSNLFISGGDKNYGYIYSLNGYGNYFQDNGLRIKASASTRSIAVETLASDHKLRVSINGTTWGVPMVATTHTQASALRIYDGASVKALVDITP